MREKVKRERERMIESERGQERKRDKGSMTEKEMRERERVSERVRDETHAALRGRWRGSWNSRCGAKSTDTQGKHVCVHENFLWEITQGWR